MKDIVQELREKPSRDNRDLLDRAADEIEGLREDIEYLKKVMAFVAKEIDKDERPKR